MTTVEKTLDKNMKIPKITDINVIKNLRIYNLEKTWHVLQNTILYLLRLYCSLQIAKLKGYNA